MVDKRDAKIIEISESLIDIFAEQVESGQEDIDPEAAIKYLVKLGDVDLVRDEFVLRAALIEVAQCLRMSVVPEEEHVAVGDENSVISFEAEEKFNIDVFSLIFEKTLKEEGVPIIFSFMSGEKMEFEVGSSAEQIVAQYHEKCDAIKLAQAKPKYPPLHLVKS